MRENEGKLVFASWFIYKKIVAKWASESTQKENSWTPKTTCLPVFIPSGSGDATTVKYGSFLTFALKVGFFLQFSQWNPDQLRSMVIQLNSWSLPQFWYLRLVPRPNIYPSVEQDISVEGQGFELDLSWKCFHCVEVHKSLSNIPLKTLCINIGLRSRVKILFYFWDRIQISWHFFQPRSLNSHRKDCWGTRALSCSSPTVTHSPSCFSAQWMKKQKKQISFKIWILKRVRFLNSREVNGSSFLLWDKGRAGREGWKSQQMHLCELPCQLKADTSGWVVKNHAALY